jgi:cytochrome P450
MKEVLRFHPIAAMASGRKCTADTNLKNVRIEKGTDVVLDTLTLHFDKELWGQDADEFKPERQVSLCQYKILVSFKKFFFLLNKFAPAFKHHF